MKYSNSLAIVALSLTLSSPTVITAALAAHSPPIALAEPYTNSLDISKYLVSEKYDGARAWWNGKHLISRGGNIYHAPAWFTDPLPDHPLDGELWLGRGQFQELMQIIRDTTPNETAWKSVRYIVFDVPTHQDTFKVRQEKLKQVVQNTNSPWISQASQLEIKNNQDLQTLLESTIAKGGEGLILQRSDLHYIAGRHSGMLKLKPHQDAEATVVGYEAGKGKYQGQTGSLIVVNSAGKRFKLGSGLSDAQRRNPPAIGSQVTYRYQGYTNSGKPRFAVFLRERQAE